MAKKKKKEEVKGCFKCTYCQTVIVDKKVWFDDGGIILCQKCLKIYL